MASSDSLLDADALAAALAGWYIGMEVDYNAVHDLWLPARVENVGSPAAVPVPSPSPPSGIVWLRFSVGVAFVSHKVDMRQRSSWRRIAPAGEGKASTLSPFEVACMHRWAPGGSPGRQHVRLHPRSRFHAGMRSCPFVTGQPVDYLHRQAAAGVLGPAQQWQRGECTLAAQPPPISAHESQGAFTPPPPLHAAEVIVDPVSALPDGRSDAPGSQQLRRSQGGGQRVLLRVTSSGDKVLGITYATPAESPLLSTARALTLASPSALAPPSTFAKWVPSLTEIAEMPRSGPPPLPPQSVGLPARARALFAPAVDTTARMQLGGRDGLIDYDLVDVLPKAVRRRCRKGRPAEEVLASAVAAEHAHRSGSRGGASGSGGSVAGSSVRGGDGTPSPRSIISGGSAGGTPREGPSGTNGTPVAGGAGDGDGGSVTGFVPRYPSPLLLGADGSAAGHSNGASSGAASGAAVSGLTLERAVSAPSPSRGAGDSASTASGGVLGDATSPSPSPLSPGSPEYIVHSRPLSYVVSQQKARLLTVKRHGGAVVPAKAGAAPIAARDKEVTAAAASQRSAGLWYLGRVKWELPPSTVTPGGGGGAPSSSAALRPFVYWFEPALTADGRVSMALCKSPAAELQGVAPAGTYSVPFVPRQRVECRKLGGLWGVGEVVHADRFFLHVLAARPGAGADSNAAKPKETASFGKGAAKLVVSAPPDREKRASATAMGGGGGGSVSVGVATGSRESGGGDESDLVGVGYHRLEVLLLDGAAPPSTEVDAAVAAHDAIAAASRSTAGNGGGRGSLHTMNGHAIADILDAVVGVDGMGGGGSVAAPPPPPPPPPSTGGGSGDASAADARAARLARIAKAGGAVPPAVPPPVPAGSDDGAGGRSGSFAHHPARKSLRLEAGVDLHAFAEAAARHSFTASAPGALGGVGGGGTTPAPRPRTLLELHGIRTHGSAPAPPAAGVAGEGVVLEVIPHTQWRLLVARLGHYCKPDEVGSGSGSASSGAGTRDRSGTVAFTAGAARKTSFGLFDLPGLYSITGGAGGAPGGKSAVAAAADTAQRSLASGALAVPDAAREKLRRRSVWG